LTTFGSDFYVPPNTINFKTVFSKFKTLHENAAVFSTVIVIFILYLFAAIWARRKDKKDLIKVTFFFQKTMDKRCFSVQWTAAPLVDNLPIDTYYYLITVHTGIGKESATKSNVHFVISGEIADSGVRKLADGKIQVGQGFDLFSKVSTFGFDRNEVHFLYKYSKISCKLNTLMPIHLNKKVK